MKKYEKAEIQIITMTTQDVITTSGDNGLYADDQYSGVGIEIYDLSIG